MFGEIDHACNPDVSLCAVVIEFGIIIWCCCVAGYLEKTYSLPIGYTVLITVSLMKLTIAYVNLMQLESVEP